MERRQIAIYGGNGKRFKIRIGPGELSEAERNERIQALTDPQYDLAVHNSLRDSETVSSSFFRSSGGLTVRAGRLDRVFTLADADPLLRVEKGSYVGRIDFAPFYVNDYRPELRSVSLALLCRDFPVFFERLPELDVRPEFIFGVTNKEMARFAHNEMGMRIVEKFEAKVGKKIYEGYQVVGRTEQMERAAFRMANRKRGNTPFSEVLMERARKQILEVKDELPEYDNEPELDFNVWDLITERGPTNEERRISVSSTTMAVAFGSMALLDAFEGSSTLAAVEVGLSAFFATRVIRSLRR